MANDASRFRRVVQAVGLPSRYADKNFFGRCGCDIGLRKPEDARFTGVLVSVNSLGVWLGTWQGEFQRVNTTWLRFYTSESQLVLTLAEAEAQRAETEARRAETAEAEVARLRALLQQHSVTDDKP